MLRIVSYCLSKDMFLLLRDVLNSRLYVFIYLLIFFFSSVILQINSHHHHHSSLMDIVDAVNAFCTSTRFGFEGDGSLLKLTVVLLTGDGVTILVFLGCLYFNPSNNHLHYMPNCFMVISINSTTITNNRNEVLSILHWLIQ